MTIALGVVCSDGIVIGTDLEYSRDYIRTVGPKLFHICPCEEYSIMIATAGSVESARQVIDLAAEDISVKYPPGTSPTARQIKARIENALREVYFKHIDPAPLDERNAMRCDLLIAIKTAYRAHLFYSDRTRLLEESDSICMGSGLYFSELMLPLVMPRLRGMEIISQVVAYIISGAKERVPGVGGGSSILMLPHEGIGDGLIKPEHEQIDRDFRALLAILPDLVSCVDLDVSEDMIDVRLKQVKGAIKVLRASQMERRSRRANRR